MEPDPDRVNSKEPFLTFIEELRGDWEASQQAERSNPSSPSGPAARAGRTLMSVGCSKGCTHGLKIWATDCRQIRTGTRSPECSRGRRSMNDPSSLSPPMQMPRPESDRFAPPCRGVWHSPAYLTAIKLPPLWITGGFRCLAATRLNSDILIDERSGDDTARNLPSYLPLPAAARRL